MLWGDEVGTKQKFVRGGEYSAPITIALLMSMMKFVPQHEQIGEPHGEVSCRK